jgi:hypothetical protein
VVRTVTIAPGPLQQRILGRTPGHNARCGLRQQPFCAIRNPEKHSLAEDGGQLASEPGAGRSPPQGSPGSRSARDGSIVGSGLRARGVGRLWFLLPREGAACGRTRPNSPLHASALLKACAVGQHLGVAPRHHRYPPIGVRRGVFARPPPRSDSVLRTPNRSRYRAGATGKGGASSGSIEGGSAEVGGVVVMGALADPTATPERAFRATR